MVKEHLDLMRAERAEEFEHLARAQGNGEQLRKRILEVVHFDDKSSLTFSEQLLLAVSLLAEIRGTSHQKVLSGESE